MNCLSGVFDKLDDLESRIGDIQAQNHAQSSPSFAAVYITQIYIYLRLYDPLKMPDLTASIHD